MQAHPNEQKAGDSAVPPQNVRCEPTPKPAMPYLGDCSSRSLGITARQSICTTAAPGSRRGESAKYQGAYSGGRTTCQAAKGAAVGQAAAGLLAGYPHSLVMAVAEADAVLPSCSRRLVGSAPTCSMEARVRQLYQARPAAPGAGAKKRVGLGSGQNAPALAAAPHTTASSSARTAMFDLPMAACSKARGGCNLSAFLPGWPNG